VAKKEGGATREREREETGVSFGDQRSKKSKGWVGWWVSEKTSEVPLLKVEEGDGLGNVKEWDTGRLAPQGWNVRWEQPLKPITHEAPREHKLKCDNPAGQGSRCSYNGKRKKVAKTNRIGKPPAAGGGKKCRHRPIVEAVQSRKTKKQKSGRHGVRGYTRGGSQRSELTGCGRRMPTPEGVAKRR